MYDYEHPDALDLPWDSEAAAASSLSFLTPTAIAPLINGPLFSVVMATYNRGRHILPSIQSVMQQSFQDFELLIVGDQCTDDTEAIIRPLLSEKVKWRNQREHSGSQSSPNNAGIELAKGTYVAYIGHDDIWSKDHLASLEALFTSEVRPTFCG